MAIVAREPAQAEGLVIVTDLDELERVEEQILQSRLTGEESVQAYLYLIPADREGRIPKPIVGPTADFVVQLVRQLNKQSKGKVRLKLLQEAPVVTDFTVSGEAGRPVPYVRVIVGAVDEVTGEVTYGIKESRRVGKDPVNVAHTRAIRRAFEIHPSYNRRLVAKFIREKLVELGYDPETFLIAGAGGSNEWAAFFAMAKAKGVRPQQLRAGVRERTGKGLSEVASVQDADKAVQAIHVTVVDAAVPPVQGSEGPAAPVPPVQDAPSSEPGTDPSDTEVIADLRASCEEYIEKIGLTAARVDLIWRRLKVAGDPTQASVHRYRAFLRVLAAMSTGTSEADAVAVGTR